MGVVTYTGPPARVTLSTGQSVDVQSGISYTFPDVDCTSLLAEYPTRWAAGDQHTATLLPVAYADDAPIGSFAKAAYSSVVTYMRGQVVNSGGIQFICLTDGTVGLDPATNPSRWLALTSGALVLGNQLVPELEILKVCNVPPGGNTAVPVIHSRDPRTGTVAKVAGAADVATPTPIIWGAGSGATVIKSTDDGSTWSLVATVAGYTAIEFIKVLASGTVVIVARNGTADAVAYDMLTAPDGSSTFTAVTNQPFTRTTPFSRLLGPTSWFQRGNGDLYIAEYGQGPFTSGARIMKSSDEGQTWTTVATFTGTGNGFLDEIRHIHGIYEDPYVANRLWVCTGDTGNNGEVGHSRVGYSDNMGSSAWTTAQSMTTNGISDGTYAKSRVVGLMFTAASVFWFADVPDAVAYVYKYDRASGGVTAVAGPYPNSGQAFAASFSLPDATPVLLTTLSVEPAFQINRDDMMRIIASMDAGASWHEVFTWRRTQIDQTSGLFPGSATAPDANGAFWLTLSNPDGGESTSSRISLKLQPRRRYAHDRNRALGNHRDRFEIAAREETITFTHPETAGSGAVATVPDVLFYLAPSDLIIVSFTFMARGVVASSGSNFWTPTLSVYDNNATKQATAGQAGGASVAIAANKAIAQLNANGLLKTKAGNYLAAGATMTGAPAALIDLTLSIRVRRANAIV